MENEGKMKGRKQKREKKEREKERDKVEEMEVVEGGSEHSEWLFSFLFLFGSVWWGRGEANEWVWGGVLRQ